MAQGLRNAAVVAFMLVLYAMTVPVVGDEAPTTSRARQQIEEGDVSAALLTLDAVVNQLRGQPGHEEQLALALVYKGWALVIATQEESAKAAFRDALSARPHLRLLKGEYPDRVIRVFEAARTGRTKSVMERPDTTTKKAGLGAAAVAAIAGGVAVLGGGVAVAASGDDPPPTPTTTQPPRIVTETFQGTVTHVHGTNPNNYFPFQVSAAGTVRASLACEFLEFIEVPGGVKYAIYPGLRDFPNGTGNDYLALAGEFGAGCSQPLSVTVTTPQMHTIRVFSTDGTPFKTRFILTVEHP